MPNCVVRAASGGNSPFCHRTNHCEEQRAPNLSLGQEQDCWLIQVSATRNLSYITVEGTSVFAHFFLCLLRGDKEASVAFSAVYIRKEVDNSVTLRTVSMSIIPGNNV